MERTKPTKIQLDVNQLHNKFMVLSTLTNRLGMAAQLGMQSFDGMRNMMEILGYPTNLVFDDFYARYQRQDIAKAIIDRPAKRTWKGDFTVYESNDDKETTFEKAWKGLYNDKSLKSAFLRLDKLTGLGKYGVLLLGMGDIKSLETYAEPLTGNKQLLYVRPLSEGSAKISTWETNPASDRYGKPLLYNIQLTDATTTTSVSLQVHYSRVLHVVDDILESEVEGTPRLTAVFNRLMDIDKIVGGDAEMFWKGARPGYAGKVDKDFQLTTETRDALKDQLDEYEHGLRRFLVNQGVDMQALTQQISDPASHLNIQLQMISAETGIPKRILTGTEEAKLAGGQDSDEWATYIQSRREEYAEPRIIRPFVNYMIKLGVLPKPVEEYSIEWEDLFAPSESQKADVGVKRAQALKEYTTNPMAASVIPEAAFMEFFLGLDQEQIDLITEMQKAQVLSEPAITAAEQALLDEQDI